MEAAQVVSKVAYRIDANDRVTDVNDDWSTFADNNGAGELHKDAVVGRVLWDFLTDPTTIHLYHMMCTRLRRGSPPVGFRFRCDSPETRRLLAMDMRSTDGRNVHFTVSTVAEQTRASMPFVGVCTPQSGDLLMTMCGWCKRVRLADLSWVEIEQGIEPLGLFQTAAPAPAVSHGICESCERAMLQDLDGSAVTLGALPGAGS